jgi:multidrug efflux pump subunit AcrA (membrane-fusion protein)
VNERILAPFRRSLALRILAVALLIVIVGVAIFAAVYASRQPRPSYATARLGDVVNSIATTGSIQAMTYQADFAVDGTLSEVDVLVGQRVRKGATLAKLDVAPFQSALATAQNSESRTQQNVSAAQNAQSQAQNAVDSAGSALSAQQSYAQLQCASQPNDPDACAAANAATARAEAQVALARGQLAAAQTQVTKTQSSANAARAATQRAQAQLAATTLKAPHDGTVTTINGAVGGKPGATANGVASFITIMDTSAPLVTALVNYRDVGQIHTGQAATFRVAQASSTEIFTGTVEGISPQGHGSGASLSYPVTLALDPGSLSQVTLLPGMTADTRIITSARYHVIVIPASAVNYARTAAPSNGSGVLTAKQISAAHAQANALAEAAVAAGFDTTNDPLTPTYLVGFQKGKYVAIPVVLGLSDGQHWEVVAGLKAGQQVVDGQRGIFG